MVDYDNMCQQIGREAKELINRKEASPGSVPLFSYKQERVEMSFTVPEFSDSNIVSLLGLVRGYYNLVQLPSRIYAFNFSLECSLKDPKLEWQLHQASSEERSAFERTNKLEIEIKKEYMVDGKCTTIKFSKKDELSQEEINCFLEVWKTYAKLNNKTANPQVSLEELGAVFYQPDPSHDWDILAGYDKVKQEVLETLIRPLFHPEVYQELTKLTRTRPGSCVPHSVLFEGPPGTGKTTMAKIVASLSKIPLVYVPVESIMSKWYGESENRLAGIFDNCQKLERSVLFLDEIDSLAGTRGDKMHEATRRVLGVLLRKMDGLISADNIITIGATNTEQDLDPALKNRFNRIINFPLPAVDERKAIFSYYAKHLVEEDLSSVAEIAEGCSGRDIENICNDAERRWADSLISSEQEEISAPSVKVYLVSIASRNHGNGKLKV
ncbi:MAG: ATP-binding protein [Candidatus Woesearchaeota archaeon]